MKRTFKRATLTPFTLLVSVMAGIVVLPVAAQDSAAEACTEAARLIQEDNDLVGALEEARWCVEVLEQMKEKQAADVFPDQVGRFTGGETSSQKALGMSMIERDYASDDETINVTLTGGGAASAGLAAIAQLGMQMGSDAGRKFRIQRRTVIEMADSDEAQYMVQLRSGGMLNVTSSSASKDSVLEFLNEFPIADLDDALKE